MFIGLRRSPSALQRDGGGDEGSQRRMGAGSQSGGGVPQREQVARVKKHPCTRPNACMP